jgi:hypothetical protein
MAAGFRGQNGLFVGWDRFRLDAPGDGGDSEGVLGGVEVLPEAEKELIGLLPDS